MYQFDGRNPLVGDSQHNLRFPPPGPATGYDMAAADASKQEMAGLGYIRYGAVVSNS